MLGRNTPPPRSVRDSKLDRIDLTEPLQNSSPVYPSTQTFVPGLPLPQSQQAHTQTNYVDMNSFGYPKMSSTGQVSSGWSAAPATQNRDVGAGYHHSHPSTARGGHYPSDNGYGGTQPAQVRGQK